VADEGELERNALGHHLKKKQERLIRGDRVFAQFLADMPFEEQPEWAHLAWENKQIYFDQVRNSKDDEAKDIADYKAQYQRTLRENIEKQNAENLPTSIAPTRPGTSFKDVLGTNTEGNIRHLKPGESIQFGKSGLEIVSDKTQAKVNAVLKTNPELEKLITQSPTLARTHFQLHSPDHDPYSHLADKVDQNPSQYGVKKRLDSLREEIKLERLQKKDNEINSVGEIDYDEIIKQYQKLSAQDDNQVEKFQQYGSRQNPTDASANDKNELELLLSSPDDFLKSFSMDSNIQPDQDSEYTSLVGLLERENQRREMASQKSRQSNDDDDDNDNDELDLMPKKAAQTQHRISHKNRFNKTRIDYAALSGTVSDSEYADRESDSD
jgi:hypothetical protein